MSEATIPAQGTVDVTVRRAVAAAVRTDDGVIHFPKSVA